MTATITWTVNKIEGDAETGGVTIVDYSVNGVDEKFSQTAYGILKFSPDVSSETFIPLDELEEANVIEWVKTKLGSEIASSIEAKVISQIESQKTPAITPGESWEINDEALSIVMDA